MARTPGTQSPATKAKQLLSEYLKAGIVARTRVMSDGSVIIEPVTAQMPPSAEEMDLDLTDWARK